MPIFAKFSYENQIIEVNFEDLLCPITKQLLVEPVILSDGYTYSKEALLKEIAAADAAGMPFKSPVTGDQISTAEGGFTNVIFPNRAVADILAHPYKDGDAIIAASTENFLCPIAFSLMDNPVLESDGRTYNFDTLSKYLHSQPNAVLPMDRSLINLYYPNRLLKAIIKKFVLTKAALFAVTDPLHIEIIKATIDGDLKILKHLQEAQQQQQIGNIVLNNDGYQIVHLAVQFGHIAILDWLRDCNCLDCTIEKNAITPLHLAALFNNLAVVQYLQQHNANFKAVTKDSFSVAHYAVVNNIDPNVIRYILEVAPYLLDMQTQNGKTILLLAALKNAKLLPYLLFEKLANHNLFDDQGNTVLHIMSSGEPVLAVAHYAKMILHCANIGVKKNQQGYTALHSAVMSKNYNFIKGWLDSGVTCPLNEPDLGNTTPLIYACSFKLVEISKLLLTSGADPNLETRSGSTAIFFAIQQNELNIVKLLHSHGAKLFTANNNGQTPLDIAADLPAAEPIIDFILQLGVLDSTGANPLHLIAASKVATTKYTYVIEKLLAKMPAQQFQDYLAMQDNNAMLPIRYAFSTGNLEFAKYLLQHGSLLPEASPGLPIICLAANSDAIELLRLLIQLNYNIYEQNNADGNNGLVFALLQGYAEFARVLLAAERQQLLRQYGDLASIPADFVQLLDRPNHAGQTARLLLLEQAPEFLQELTTDLESVVLAVEPVVVAQAAAAGAAAAAPAVAPQDLPLSPRSAERRRARVV